MMAGLYPMLKDPSFLPWIGFVLGLAVWLPVWAVSRRRRPHHPQSATERTARKRSASLPVVLAALLWGLLFGLLIARHFGAALPVQAAAAQCAWWG